MGAGRRLMFADAKAPLGGSTAQSRGAGEAALLGYQEVHGALESGAAAVVGVEDVFEGLARHVERARAADERHAVDTAGNAALELDVGQRPDVGPRISGHHRAQLRPCERAALPCEAGRVAIVGKAVLVEVGHAAQVRNWRAVHPSLGGRPSVLVVLRVPTADREEERVRDCAVVGDHLATGLRNSQVGARMLE